MIEDADVLHGVVLATFTLVIFIHVPLDGLARTVLAKVRGKRLNVQETDETKEFANPILKWSARQAPAVVNLQGKCCLGSHCGASLDTVSFVLNSQSVHEFKASIGITHKNDSMKLDGVNQRLFLVEAVFLLESFLLSSVHGLQRVVRHQDYIVFLEIFDCLDFSSFSVGTVHDESLQCPIRVALDLVHPLHQGNRRNKNKGRLLSGVVGHDQGDLLELWSVLISFNMIRLTDRLDCLAETHLVPKKTTLPLGLLFHSLHPCQAFELEGFEMA